ncbi:DUF1311 domain-containing protein [Mucilaginibacter daejeonensis]|uniref:lysozyme inhibitor LprI family protein n=1 Tax=Mucilaginibacter daejeonensis TaxID=398049 RepID=UPI001D17C2C6|nr:lysozyme inhibitor LprI family protein [Mucilaginibacter daejeonensis]UEG54428.1 DUF1311 domain-containing protein [Mucilaginibacter daejeonensis]
MNNINKLLLAIVIMIATTAAGARAQTQGALTANAGAAYQKADKELNRVYQKILKEYASQPLFIKKFKVAQRLWVQLRDAELAARYPARGSYGSAGPMCENIYLEDLTKQRTKFLKQWLDGIPEGDVCTGSVKVKR